MKPAKNSLEDELALVSAPEDFPKNLQSLSKLDSSLRCPICKDFYSAPVVIHIPRCCHTFCSTCIRTCFNNNSNTKIGAAGLGGVGLSQRCPVCKIEAQEEKVKPVPSLESAVASWIEARDQILGLVDQVNTLQNQLDRQTRAPAVNDLAGPSSNKRIKLDSLASTSRPEPTQNRADPEPIKDALRSADGPSEPRRTRAAARSSKGKAPDSKPPTSSEPAPSLKRKHQSSSAKHSDPDSDIEFLGDSPTDPNASVKCPLCATQLANSKMDAHVTRCLSGTQPTGKLSFKALNKSSGLLSSKGKLSSKSKPNTAKQIPEEKLPLPHFASLKPKDLRAELARHKLSVDGSKDVQTRRLSRFITLFNANLDADPTRRKPLDALRAELGEWERLQDADAAKRRKLAAQPGFAVEQGNGKRWAVVSSEKEYLVRNRDQFAELTLQAARSARTAKQASQVAGVEPGVDELVGAEDGSQMAQTTKEVLVASAVMPGVSNEHAEADDGPELARTAQASKEPSEVASAVEPGVDAEQAEADDGPQAPRIGRALKEPSMAVETGLDKKPAETDDTPPGSEHEDAQIKSSGQKLKLLSADLDVDTLDV